MSSTKLLLPSDLVPHIILYSHPSTFNRLSRISRVWRRTILSLPIPRLVSWIFAVVNSHCRHLIIQLPGNIVIYHNPLIGSKRVIGIVKTVMYRGKPVLVPLHEIALTDTLRRAVGRVPTSISVAMAELAFCWSVRVLRAEWCAPHVMNMLSSGYRSPAELLLALRSLRHLGHTPQMKAVLAALKAAGCYRQQGRDFYIDLIFSRGRRLSLYSGTGEAIWRKEDGSEFCTPYNPEEYVLDHCPWYKKYDKLGDECLLRHIKSLINS